MTQVVIATEHLTPTLKEEMGDLLQAHWVEVARDQDRIPLAVDWAAYDRMEEAGILAVYTARRGGELIGYSVFFVRPSLHYSLSVHAVNDIIYVDPADRGMTGVRLVRYADQELRKHNVVKTIYHTKLDPPLDRLGTLLGKLGYDLIESIYAKVV